MSSTGSGAAYKVTPAVPMVGRGLGEQNLLFEERSKGEIFTSAESSQKLKVNKLMVNIFSAMQVFLNQKLK